MGCFYDSNSQNNFQILSINISPQQINQSSIQTYEEIESHDKLIQMNALESIFYNIQSEINCPQNMPDIISQTNPTSNTHFGIHPQLLNQHFNIQKKTFFNQNSQYFVPNLNSYYSGTYKNKKSKNNNDFFSENSSLFFVDNFLDNHQSENDDINKSYQSNNNSQDDFSNCSNSHESTPDITSLSSENNNEQDKITEVPKNNTFDFKQICQNKFKNIDKYNNIIKILKNENEEIKKENEFFKLKKQDNIKEHEVLNNIDSKISGYLNPEIAWEKNQQFTKNIKNKYNFSPKSNLKFLKCSNLLKLNSAHQMLKSNLEENKQIIHKNQQKYFFANSITKTPQIDKKDNLSKILTVDDHLISNKITNPFNSYKDFPTHLEGETKTKFQKNQQIINKSITSKINEPLSFKASIQNMNLLLLKKNKKNKKFTKLQKQEKIKFSLINFESVFAKSKDSSINVFIPPNSNELKNSNLIFKENIQEEKKTDFNNFEQSNFEFKNQKNDSFLKTPISDNFEPNLNLYDLEFLPNDKEFDYLYFSKNKKECFLKKSENPENKILSKNSFSINNHLHENSLKSKPVDIFDPISFPINKQKYDSFSFKKTLISNYSKESVLKNGNVPKNLKINFNPSLLMNPNINKPEMSSFINNGPIKTNSNIHNSIKSQLNAAPHFSGNYSVYPNFPTHEISKSFFLRQSSYSPPAISFIGSNNNSLYRLSQETLENAVPTIFYTLNPEKNNISKWHFTIRGPSNSAFKNGIYHGYYLLQNYPKKALIAYFVTPTGKFPINLDIMHSVIFHFKITRWDSFLTLKVLTEKIAYLLANGQENGGLYWCSYDLRKEFAEASRKFCCVECGKMEKIERKMLKAFKNN